MCKGLLEKTESFSVQILYKHNESMIDVSERILVCTELFENNQTCRVRHNNQRDGAVYIFIN